MLKEKLVELRKQNQMTQENLADSLHVSRSLIAKWESGKGMPQDDALNDIANLFHVSVDDLVKDSTAEKEIVKKNKKLLIINFVSAILLCFVTVFGTLTVMAFMGASFFVERYKEAEEDPNNPCKEGEEDDAHEPVHTYFMNVRRGEDNFSYPIDCRDYKTESAFGGIRYKNNEVILTDIALKRDDYITFTEKIDGEETYFDYQCHLENGQGSSYVTASGKYKVFVNELGQGYPKFTIFAGEYDIPDSVTLKSEDETKSFTKGEYGEYVLETTLKANVHYTVYSGVEKVLTDKSRSLKTTYTYEGGKYISNDVYLVSDYSYFFVTGDIEVEISFTVSLFKIHINTLTQSL